MIENQIKSPLSLPDKGLNINNKQKTTINQLNIFMDTQEDFDHYLLLLYQTNHNE